MITGLAAIFACSTIYAVVRYVVFGELSLPAAAFYLLNKPLAFSAAIYAFLAAWNNFKSNAEREAFWTKAALCCAFAHVAISFSILSRSHFPKFFGPANMNLVGELTMLSGLVTAYTLLRISPSRLRSHHIKAFRIGFCACLAAHLLAMGFKGWLSIERWNGGLPPISLLSFLFVAGSAYLFAIGRKE